jgi:hypothetical protein
MPNIMKFYECFIDRLCELGALFVRFIDREKETDMCNCCPSTINVNVTTYTPEDIAGKRDFNRALGGKLVIPRGAAFPTEGVLPGELFFHYTLGLFVRSDDNTVWIPTTTGNWFYDARNFALALFEDYDIIAENEFSAYQGFTVGAESGGSYAFQTGPGVLRLSSSAAGGGKTLCGALNFPGASGNVINVANVQTTPWLMKARFAVATDPTAYTRALVSLMTNTDYCSAVMGILGPVDAGAHFQAGVLDYGYAVRSLWPSSVAPVTGTFIDAHIRNDGTYLYASFNGEAEHQICQSTQLTSAPGFWQVIVEPAAGGSAAESVDVCKIALYLGR